MIKDFKCIKCGDCCKTIPMRKCDFMDMEVISIFDFLSKYDTPCPYYKDNSCSIYKNRPEVCKNYPPTEYVATRDGCKGDWPGKNSVTKSDGHNDGDN